MYNRFFSFWRYSTKGAPLRKKLHRPRPGHTIKQTFTIFQNVHLEICSILNFVKGFGTSFSTTFWVRFFKKIFFMLYSISWPNWISWLPFLPEILGNMCIVIICCPVCGVINLKLTIAFLSSRKKTGQKCKYLKNEKSF